MSGKRSDLGVEAAADPPVQPDTATDAVAGAGAPDTSRQPSGDHRRDAVSVADAAAQGGREEAQVLPNIVPNGPRLPAPGIQVDGPSAQEPGLTPQQTQQQALLNQLTSQSPGEAATSVVGRGSAPQPLTQGQAESLPPVQPGSTPGPAGSAGETQQPSTGTGADTPSGGSERQPGGPHHPAIGRALQVQAAVAVANVAGHPMLGSPPATLAASGPSSAVEQPLLQTVTGLNDQDAPTTGRVIRGLTAMLQQRGGSMTMRLDPPALGQLRVQMTIAGGTVTADFQPGTAEAQALLDRSIATLRSALESQGLTVERLTVHAAPSSTPARETADDQSRHPNQSSRNQSDAGDGRSRGRGDDPSQQDSPNHRFTANFADAFDAQAATATDNLSDRTGAQAA